MKKLAPVIGVVAASAVAAPTALAAPPGQGLTEEAAQCDGIGPVTAITTAGNSFWIGDTHYVIKTFSGTFTPEGGTTQEFTQTYGNKNGLTGDAIHCTGGGTAPGEGTFTFDVIGIPVR